MENRLNPVTFILYLSVRDIYYLTVIQIITFRMNTNIYGRQCVCVYARIIIVESINYYVYTCRLTSACSTLHEDKVNCSIFSFKYIIINLIREVLVSTRGNQGFEVTILSACTFLLRDKLM